MRKLLLASAAVIGGFAGGQAFAQTTTTAAPLPPTWTEGVQPTAPSGVVSGMNNLNAQGYYTKGPLPAPTPGSIVVHFNGRVVFYGFAASQSGDKNAGYKNQPYGTLGYFRFYTGVDGMTASGLRYGASVELREDAGNAGVKGAAASNTVANVGGDTMYVRRAFAYLGGTWGAVHLGQDDGAVSLLDAGVTTFQTYNDGGWNDDLPVSNTAPAFAFPSGTGAEYTTSKIAYMSPQIAGFDFMGSFEPCDCTLTDTYNVANSASPNLSSAPGGLAQRRNTFEVGGRYQGDFGPAGIYAFASYIGSGVVNNSTGAERYDDISMFFGGVAVNFGGLRVGGAVMTGADNGDEVPKPVGGANEFAYIGGIQYTLGPATVGAAYMNLKSAGALSAAGGALASQRREGGINVGGTYVLAPGLLLWLSADYGQRYQGGYDFVNGTYDSAYNNVTFRMVALGGMVRW